MAEWKVVAEKVEVFDHPNAEKLSLAKVGTIQLVVGKGMYKSGDIIVVAPKRSILPFELRSYYTNQETGLSYLKGQNKDRVGSIRLRGEESEGAALPMEFVTKILGENIPLGVDISKHLDIQEYIPEIHNTSGKRKSIGDGSLVMNVKDAVTLQRFVRHDAESFRIFQNEFIEGELVSVTEKANGSLISVAKDVYGNVAVTSKGRAEKNLVLREYPRIPMWHGRTFWKKLGNFFRMMLFPPKPPMNEYWAVAYSAGLIDFVNNQRFVNQEVMVFGEIIPYQKNYDYGFTEKTVRVFRLVVGTIEHPYGEFEGELKWVPQLYSGPYQLDKILPLAEGRETISGRSLHLKEGIVLTPAVFRKTPKGVPLIVKILNSRYKNSDDEVR